MPSKFADSTPTPKLNATKLNTVLDTLRSKGIMDDGEIVQACHEIIDTINAAKANVKADGKTEGRDPRKILNFNKHTGQMEMI